MARILAIEPHAERGATLRELIREKLNTDLVLATSSGAAIAAMSGERPDVILTSSLIPPTDDRLLAAHLRYDPALRDLPILSLPPIFEMQESRRRTMGGLLARLVGRRTRRWQACDLEALASRIRDTLDESREVAVRPAPAPAPPIETSVPAPMTAEELRLCGLGSKQKRARRWTSQELAWISSVRLAWGLELSLLNISSSGILMESGIRLTPGSRTDIHLGGAQKELVVSARIVRSRVGAVDKRGVKYLAAAEFEQPFDSLLPGHSPDRSGDSVEHLADLIARVRAGAAGGASPADLRGEFEAGVHELVNARAIRLRDAPVVENDGSDSVYFTIPTRDHSPAVLQVTFEPRCQPCPEEFAALKAAALAAAEVVEFTETSRQLSLVTA